MITTLPDRLWPIALLLSALAGCSTTSLTDSWQEPTFKRSSMDKVLVVAMTGNPTARILFEEGFVKALRDNGIQATASHAAIGSDMPNRDSVTAYLKTQDIDHLFVSDYSNVQVTKWVVPESVRTYYTGPYYPTYYGYWESYGSSVTMVRDSYVEEIRTVMLSTSVFDAQSGSVLWVGRSKSVNVDSIADDAHSLARQVVASISN